MSRSSAWLAALFFFVVPNAFAQSGTALFPPLPSEADNPANTVTPEKVALGEMLFFETKLSPAGDISCNSCHGLKTFGVDNNPTSKGHKGQKGDRNSPTVYNAALHVAQFWDGRAPNVEEQALGPILNPVEMAMASSEDVVKTLKGEKIYHDAFKKAFPGEADPITWPNVGKAIGAFERTLITPSRYDEYAKGRTDALSEAEKKGLESFTSVGCMSCHIGSTFGGQMFQKLGLVKTYSTTDVGRFKVTNNEADKYVFKVPSLRNIAKTGPYFHDGSVNDLPAAIKLMGEYQLGRSLTVEQVAQIAVFLNALTGTLPEKYR